MAVKKVKSLADLAKDASDELLKDSANSRPNYQGLLDKRKTIDPGKVTTPIATPLTLGGIRLGDRGPVSKLRQNVEKMQQSVSVGLGSSAERSNESQTQLLAGVGAHNQIVFEAKEQDRLTAEMEKRRLELEKAQGKITTTTSMTEKDLGFKGDSQGTYNGGKVLQGLDLKFTDHNGRAGAMTLSASQAANAREIIQIGKKRGFTNEEIQIALAVSLDESKLVNINGGDRDSRGLYQQRPSQGWGTVKQVTNTTYAINKFFDVLKTVKPQATPWLRGQKVQRSYSPQGLNYKGWWGAAGKILSASINPVGSRVAATSYNVSKGLTSFQNKHLGKFTDFDKAYGTQCVDLFRYYMQSLGAGRGPGMSASGGSGGALELWRNGAQTNYMSKYATRVSAKGRGAPGDIAVFDGRIGNPYGHVGVILKDNGKTITVLSSHSGNKKTDIRTYNKSALAGYWRPNKGM